MSTVYLENDDEITTAIGRIRAVTDRDAIVVVPVGSRIATSRINFKLLAREAAERRMNLVAVSDQPQVRALAISAGLPAYDSIPAAEQALATFAEQDRRLAERIDRTMPRDRPVATPADGLADQTKVYSTPPRTSSSARDGAGTPIDTALLPVQQAAGTRRQPARRRIPLAPVLVFGFAILLIAAVGYGALVFLPTATITLRPVAARILAPAFTVTADPSVAVVDATAGVIPAQQLTVPLHVEGTFNATGIDAHDVKATGTVRLRSENTLNAVTIPADTTLATADGEEFATTEEVTVPKASFDTGPTQAEVGVRAAKGGTRGNVPADAITVVPSVFASQLITATNPDPTSGGKHVEDIVITDADYANALTALSQQLEPALEAKLDEPGGVPRGLVAYAETAQVSAGQPDQSGADLVGLVEPTFTLALDATADVSAVDESLIDEVAAARVDAALRPGQHLIGDQVTASHDNGTVIGNTISYAVQASGLGFTDVDPQTLISTVRGKSLTEARAALAAMGNADISVWPDFVDHLPDQAGRISVTVVAPSAVPSVPPVTPRPASPRPSASASSS